MFKRATFAVAFLLTMSLAESRAQIIFAPRVGRGGPVVNPFVAPGFGNPYGWGWPYGGGGVFGGGTYSPPVQPAPNAPGMATAPYGITGRVTESRDRTQREGESITGHPTRFLYYSHYFMNQGGGAGVGRTGVNQPQQFGPQSPQVGFFLGGDYARARPGAAPQRPERAPSGGRR